MRISHILSVSPWRFETPSREEPLRVVAAALPPRTVAKGATALPMRAPTSVDGARTLIGESDLDLLTRASLAQSIARARSGTGSETDVLFLRVMTHRLTASVARDTRDAWLARATDFDFLTQLLTTLLASESYDPTVRSRLLVLPISEIAPVSTSEGFAALSPSEQRDFLDLWATSSQTARARLQQALAASPPVLTRAALGTGGALGSPPHMLGLLARLSGDLRDDMLTALLSPERIIQDRWNTCGYTSLEYLLVHEEPAEYVRLVVELSESGRAVMQSGGVLETGTGEDWDIRRRDDDQRLLCSRLFQSAAMNSTSLLGYDIASDTTFPGLPPLGAHVSEMSALAQDLTGHDFSSSFLLGSDATLHETLDASSHGRPAFALLATSEGGHWVNVLGTREVGGETRVRLRNPWGDGRTAERLGKELGLNVLSVGDGGVFELSLDELRAHTRALTQRDA